MSIQSPKSKRSQTPGMREKDDGMTEKRSGGNIPQQGSGSSGPSVPSGLKHQGGRHQGNVDAESAVPTHAPAPHQGGGPGFAKDKGDGMRKGGTVHQT